MEFKDLHAIIKEICISNNGTCNLCPLGFYGSCGVFNSNPMKRYTYDFIEKVCAKWKIDHTPVYPSLYVWQKRNYPQSTCTMRPCHFIQCPYVDLKDGKMKCSECENRPTPEKLAKLLGIEKEIPKA